jgi:hypothetical protein
MRTFILLVFRPAGGHYEYFSVRFSLDAQGLVGRAETHEFEVTHGYGCAESDRELDLVEREIHDDSLLRRN